ncbi:MAG: DUF2330 domain-containing protein [Polyangiaceae bacterium]|nr:DUF2330 domain-containing protein [Polyangiaceae bacterium]
MPAISVERVALVHDEQVGLEHLIREVTFNKVDKPFGFVIPTPSKPGVFKADGFSWSTVERKFPMAAPSEQMAAGFGSGAGRLGGAGGVKVLEAKRVGSFAAYVLKAEDGKGLKDWLDRNRFVTTPSSEAWLNRYSKLGFYFAALRFEPSFFKEKVAHIGRWFGSETLRISFASAVPYYPYAEPDREDVVPDRVLVLWLFTNGPARVPVAAVQGPEGIVYKKPWREGFRRGALPVGDLTSLVGEETFKALLIPKGGSDWQVQVFEDQKRSRKGFGDVLLVPEAPREFSADALEKAKVLLPLLDPALEAK